MEKIKNKLSDWFYHERRLKKAINELNALTDRDLSDMGISRSDISSVVRGKPRVVSII
jgi:uncharacterized protein YjiS (DUF1127 family)